MQRVVFLPFVFVMAASTARANQEIYSDGRDAWTLMPRKLLNRQLPEQLEASEETHRLGRDLGMLATAVDGSVGGQLPIGDSELTRFHGFYFLDTFLALRPLLGLDLNLNLTLTNPSASDGYRFSDQLLAGFALHLYRDLFNLDGEAVRIEFLGIDLDLVTVGHGLLIEEVPLEGHSVALTWKGLRLKELLGGRTFWFDDDLLTVSLGLVERHLGIYWARWMQQASQENSSVLKAQAGVPQPDSFVDYFGLSGELRPLEPLRLAGEYTARLRGQSLKSAFLLRADYLERRLGPFELHVGYQLRFYQRRFGPKNKLVTPTSIPNVPWREDSYVTNSFEFFGASHYYDQWGQTGMLEVAYRGLGFLAPFFYGEIIWRRTSDPRKGSKRVVYLQRFGRAPGQRTDFFYRGGVELYPWTSEPHRVRAYVTNKLVAAGSLSILPDSRRFTHEPLMVFEMEVFL